MPGWFAVRADWRFHYLFKRVHMHFCRDISFTISKWTSYVFFGFDCWRAEAVNDIVAPNASVIDDCVHLDNWMRQAGLPLVQQYLFQFERLVREQLPRLGAHFEEEIINPSMYASQWFITVFSYSFPFSLELRIWDVFLYEVRNLIYFELCILLSKPSYKTKVAPEY